jgi:hypothetical protein
MERMEKGTLWFRRAVAEIAVKVAHALGLDNLKALGNAIHLHFPRIFIRCRKAGVATPPAIRTPENFNPMIAGHP